MSSVPQFLPLYDDITAESEKRISLFLSRVKTEVTPLPKFFVIAANSGTTTLPTTQNEERLLAYAYLRSRHWNVDSAIKMAQGAAQFRVRHKLDDQPVFPSPFSLRGYDEMDIIRRFKLPPFSSADPTFRQFHAMNSLLNVGYHKWDKRGLPVAYMLLGRIEVGDIVKKCQQLVPVGQKLSDVTDRYMALLVETGWWLCRYQDAVLTEKPQAGINKGPERRNCVTIVVDAKGVGYRSLHKSAIDLLKETLTHVRHAYADCVHRILVVNAPAMIRFGFDIIKPALNDEMVSKFTFVSPEDTPAVLDRVIGKENVPACVGGACNCAGLCIANINPSAILSSEEGDSEDVMTENIKLSAGSKHQKVYELAQGEDVIWEFMSTKGVDVRFSIYFYPKQEGISVSTKKKARVVIDKSVKKTTREAPLVKFEKLKDGADHFMAPEDGILQLVWDNTKSWVQDKPIQMRVYKSAPLAMVSEDE